MDKDDSCSEDEEEDDDDSDDDSDEDDTAELMKELEKIKQERQQEQEKAELLAKEQEEREMEERAMTGNPLLDHGNASSSSTATASVKRRWDDDVIFKNQTRGVSDKPEKRFINDMLRSDFHRKYVLLAFSGICSRLSDFANRSFLSLSLDSCPSTSSNKSFQIAILYLR